jgi:hypothetical protein
MSSSNIYSTNTQPIPGYLGYYLTDLFQIIGKTGRPLTQCGEKHKFVNVRVGKESTILYVHRAVALVHVSGYFEGAWCDHIDDNSLNNHPKNLRWVTPQQNNVINKKLTKEQVSKRIDIYRRKIKKLELLLID